MRTGFYVTPSMADNVVKMLEVTWEILYKTSKESVNFIFSLSQADLSPFLQEFLFSKSQFVPIFSNRNTLICNPASSAPFGPHFSLHRRIFKDIIHSPTERKYTSFSQCFKQEHHEWFGDLHIQKENRPGDGLLWEIKAPALSSSRTHFFPLSNKVPFLYESLW